MKYMLLCAFVSMYMCALENHFEVRLAEIKNELDKKISIYDEGDRFLTHVFPKTSLPYNYQLSSETITRLKSIHTGIIETKFSDHASSRSIRIELTPTVFNNMLQPPVVLLLNSEINFDKYTNKITVIVSVTDYHTHAQLKEKRKTFDAFKNRIVSVELEIEKSNSKSNLIKVDFDLD